MVNGSLHLAEGARIGGPVLVIGGRIEGPGIAGLADTARVWMAPLRIQMRGQDVELRTPAGPELPPFLELDLGVASLRPTLRGDGAYNRVEGLPIRVGGVLEAGRRNPTRVEGFAVWRSVSGLEVDSDNLGHRVGVEQELGGRGEARLGFAHRSVVRPIEDRGISDMEASLTTFFLHRDFRDWYERDGWEVWAEVTPTGRPLRLALSYMEEDHGFAAIRDPWTLRGRDAAWRLQPLVAEGSVRTLGAEAELDMRNDPDEPSDGWWVSARVRRTMGGTLTVPRGNDGEDDPGSVTMGSLPLSTDGELDLRRYNRLGPTLRVSTRALLAGSVNGNPLAPQFQRTLGGEGSLPGHPRFSMACGARDATAASPQGEVEGAAWVSYGCDRIALGQIELRGALPVVGGSRELAAGVEDWELRSLLNVRPEWTVFGNVGRGWSLADEMGVEGTFRDSPVRADVGVGLHLGSLGLHWAVPLNRRDRGVNFFVRLQKRF
ncbi:MAG: hypothetical protein EA352_00910 [Gemmatimonadales bacterium]|nr:MAG: hypothetical protein EA352_00910 [Gemmatimonadales bacterium]